MRNQQTRRCQWWKWAGFLVLLGAVGCGGSSSGCSCAKPIPGGFPSRYKSKNVTQIKVTRKGFDFIQNNANALLKTFLPTGLEFNVPKSTSGNTQVCLNGNCKVKLNVRRLTIGLKPTKTLLATMWLDISSTKITIKVKTKIGFIPVSKTCDIYVTTNNKQVSAPITVGVDSRNQGLSMSIGTPSISISSGDFKISGDIICKGINLLKGLFKGMIEKQVKDALGKVVGEFTCMKCKSQADCPAGSTCGSGTCNQGGKCLPMDVGFSGAVSLSELLSGLGNPTANDLWFGINLGGRAEVKTTGLELGMLGGTHAKTHPCVRPIKFPPLPPVPLFPFPASSPDGQPYMLGAAVSQVMLDSASRGLYQTGALCIRIDSSISKDLGGVFSVKNLGGLISPSLPKLVGQGDAPLVIALRPSTPPEITIGKGVIGKDAKGNPTVKEPLLELKLSKLNFDFLVFLHDRWTRLFTYQVDVTLPMALAVKPGNKLGLVLGDLGTAMANPKVVSSYMVAEDDKKLANGLFNLLKTILPLATGALGNQEFTLPNLQGMKLTIRGITGQIPRTDRPGRYKFLGLFADLSLAPPTKPLLPRFPIGLRLVKMQYPPNLRSLIRQQVRLTKWPAAVLEVIDTRPDREYSFRLNSGMWSPYYRGTQIVFENPQFLMQGLHHLRVRSRSISHPYQEDAGQGELKFRVDYTPPSVSISKTAQGILPTVNDNVTQPTFVSLEYRVNGGAWVQLGPGESIPSEGLSQGDKIELLAKDLSGNVRKSSFTWSQGATSPVAPTTSKQQVANPPKSAAFGCQQLPTEHPTLPLSWMLMLLGLWAVRKTSHRSK